MRSERCNRRTSRPLFALVKSCSRIRNTSHPLFRKNDVYNFVAGQICIQLRLPKQHIRGWSLAMFQASVPKAAVNEHDDALVRKNEVRTPRQRLFTSPARNGRSAKNFDQT